ncbi:MAG: hypothetical protein LBH84_02925 [Prevotellaceae bacterium]|nr:hypothetical protein [Prevotellaceae bacterium]
MKFKIKITRRPLSATEKGMIITIALLALLVSLRWGYVRRRAADGMRYLKPVDSAWMRQPEAESCE